MRRRCLTLDVCTSRRFAGNPFAVVLDAAGRNGTGMHWIARECNLAETVCVLPRRKRAIERGYASADRPRMSEAVTSDNGDLALMYSVTCGRQ
jgi:hypothetical protein